MPFSTQQRHLPQVGRPLRVRSRLRRETLLQRCLTAHGNSSSALDDGYQPYAADD